MPLTGVNRDEYFRMLLFGGEFAVTGELPVLSYYILVDSQDKVLWDFNFVWGALAEWLVTWLGQASSAASGLIRTWMCDH